MSCSCNSFEIEQETIVAEYYKLTINSEDNFLNAEISEQLT